jgi:phosphate transport system substrate-binding protein
MHTRTSRILFLYALVLAACGTPPSAYPLPTPQGIFVTYPPELRPYADALASCAQQYPDISIYLEETVEELLPNQQTDVFLALGGTPAALSDWYATLLSDDTLVVTVNQQNPLRSLSREELRAIWSGNVSDWQALGGQENDIQVWAYPTRNTLRKYFDEAVMAGEMTSSSAWLAPDPQAVLEAVAAEPRAIGYLPASWLGTPSQELIASIKSLTLDRETEESLSQPVIALTETEPQAGLHTLLLCFLNRD